jgi:2-alkyl-3-oxoalkanoate reductase
MKILVTGATGFLGGWVLSKLETEFGTAQVMGTGRSLTRIQGLIQAGHQMIGGDLTDPLFVSNHFQGVTHVVHCAAKSSLWGSYDSFYQDNVTATLNLLQHIHSLQRFIFISTPSIYFRFSDSLQIREDEVLPGKLVNHYATTKYIAEQEVLKYENDGLVRVVIRPRAIIGAGDTHIVPRVIRAYKAGRLRIIGDGKTICDFTSVKNVAHAVSLAISTPNDIDGMVFNLTDDKPLVLWQLIENTLKELGFQPNLRKVNYRLVYLIATCSELLHRMFGLGEPVLTRYGVGLLRYSQTLDISRAKLHLGYRPLITTEESINEFIASYMNAQ